VAAGETLGFQPIGHDTYDLGHRSTQSQAISG
jgi:hypothetical protein